MGVKRYFLLFLVFVYVALLFWLSFMQTDALKDIYDRTGVIDDDALHAASFFILGFILHMALLCFGVRWSAAWAFAGALLLAFAGEGVQSFLSYRHAAWLDLGLHALGALLYTAIALIVTWIILRASE